VHYIKFVQLSLVDDQFDLEATNQALITLKQNQLEVSYRHGRDKIIRIVVTTIADCHI
jgi:hypothetical protein